METRLLCPHCQTPFPGGLTGRNGEPVPCPKCAGTVPNVADTAPPDSPDVPWWAAQTVLVRPTQPAAETPWWVAAGPWDRLPACRNTIDRLEACPTMEPPAESPAKV